MLELIRNLSAKKNDEGASAVEYGLLVAGIAAIIVLIVFALGNVVNTGFDTTCSTIATKGTATAGGC